MGEKCCRHWVSNHNLLTRTIWRWESAILMAFSHLSVCLRPRTGSHFHLGDIAVAANQPESKKKLNPVCIFFYDVGSFGEKKVSFRYKSSPTDPWVFSFIAFPSNRPQVSAVTSAGNNKSPSSQIQGPYHVCSYGVKRPKLVETTPPDVICIHNVDSCVNRTTSIARGYSCTLFQRLHGFKKIVPRVGIRTHGLLNLYLLK